MAGCRIHHFPGTWQYDQLNVKGLLKNIGRNYMNMRGFRTPRKLVIFESDDWGSIRMPSIEVYHTLLREGTNPDSDPYMRYDALESNEDLEKLFDVLTSVKDRNGRHAVFTANAVMANPDFPRIRDTDFREYHYEPFTTTLNHYPGRERVYSLWKKGMELGVFLPQFHGREHLNVAQWMQDLQGGNELLMKAFDQNMISISSVRGRMRYSYMEGMDSFSENEQQSKKQILETGHQLFVEHTGYGSKTFIANCYIWDRTTEDVLRGLGVETMQGIFYQSRPALEGHKPVKHYMGEIGASGMSYTIRNVFFEPALIPETDWVGESISRIHTAFKWKKPAIIGSHRLNYIGSIDPVNRDRNLASLSTLLRRILERWPDVEFMSSADLSTLLRDNSNG